MKYFLFDKAQKYVTRINTEYLIEAHYTEEINTAGQLEFTLPATMRLPQNVFFVCITDPNDETSYLMFKIITEKVTDEQVTYTCIENAYDELASYTYIKDKRPTATADYMLKQALEGTRWSVGSCPEVSPKFCSFYYISVLEAIQKIVNLWGFEVQFQVKIDGITNEIKQRNVNMYTKLGERTNKRFEYGSNLLSVTQANDSTGLYTALVGRGKGVQVSEGDTDTDPDGYGRRITFADVVWSTQSGNPLNKPAGQEYLEDPNATAAYGFPDGHPRIGFVVFQDCEDPNELIQLTYNKLQEVNHPQVQFSANIAEVGSLNLGDTIAIIRHDIGIEYYTRVFKVVHDLLDSSNNTVELGDNIAGSNSITQQISTIKDNQSNVQNAIDTIVMNGADGNKLFFGTTFPANGTDGDIFYKTLENGGTEMYIYKDGGWQLVVSTEELDAVKKKVDEQTSQIQQAVDSANSAVSKADEAVASIGNAETMVKNAQATANQNKQDIATVQGNIESTKSDLQSTVQELQGVSNDLNTVKQQAISQGQSIIDIQRTTIALGTQMADVQGNVSSLQQTTQSLQSSVQDNKNNIASIKQTAGSIQSTVASMQNAGDNLIVNSDFEQGGYHWDLNGWQISNDDEFRNHKIISKTQSGLGSANYNGFSATDLIPVQKGQTISIGVWVKANNIDSSGDGNWGAAFGVNWYADNHSGRNHWTDFNDRTYCGNHDWQFLKMEGLQPPSDSHFARAHFFLTQNGSAQFALPIMVYGDTLPAWSPSPLDSATAIDMSSVKQTVSSLQSTVQNNTGDISTLKQTATQLQSSIKDNANNISSIKQTADSVQSTVANMKVGGTNLLPETENYTGYLKWGNVEYLPTYSYDDYSFTPQTKIIHLWTDGNNPIDNASPTPDNKPFNIIQGNVYTFSAYVWNYGGKDQSNELVTVHANNGSNSLELGTLTTTLTGVATKYKLTFTASQAGEYTRFRVVHRNGSAMTGGSMYIAEMKLEEGNVATDWSPSPYDLASQTDMSSVQQKVDSITSTVQSQSGDISQLKQTASSLQSVVSTKADLSQVTQMGNVIQSVVQNIGPFYPDGDFSDTDLSKYYDPWDTCPNLDNFSVVTNNKDWGYYLQIYTPHGTINKAITKEYLPINAQYSLTFKGKSLLSYDGKLNGSFMVYMHFFDSNKNAIQNQASYYKYDNNNVWQDFSLSFTPPSNAAYVRVETMLDNSKGDGAYYGALDNLSLDNGGSTIASKISQMSDDINLRVQKGDLLSQINIEAGQTLIQSDKLYLDASSVVFSGNAFIPSAAITDLSADKITTGTLNAANVHIINLDVSNLVGNTTSFIQSNWNSINRQIKINGDEMNFYAGNEHITINNGNILWYNSQGFKMMGLERSQEAWQPLGGGLSFNTYGGYALQLGDATLDVAGVKLKIYNDYMLTFVQYNDGSIALQDAHGNGFWWSNNGFGISHEHKLVRLDGVSLPININSDGTVQSWITI